MGALGALQDGRPDLPCGEVKNKLSLEGSRQNRSLRMDVSGPRRGIRFLFRLGREKASAAVPHPGAAPQGCIVWDRLYRQ